ncbi:MAG TPA: 2Fe-2S iron-sulfur cluster-binding protein, partial [Chitinophagaceae bacterium]|nr:2Fe-2S iron-sulfur cluster-binding protein [Chitinophagaceae bacterium]
MNLTIKVWRQKNRNAKGSFETMEAKGISSEMSFLEMFDVMNEKLIVEGKDPIAFDHDCREGICGACSMH